MTSPHPERDLVLTYAPAAGRPALAALLALDDALAQLLQTTREPALGQIRLAWWRERLADLDVKPPPAEPVLRGIADHVVSQGVSGASLAPIVDGWEVLLEEALDADALRRFGEGRGHLFVAAGSSSMGAGTDPLAEAGQGWALADLARHLGTVGDAEIARDLARPLLQAATTRRWSGRGRALGAIAHLALRDLDLPAGTPAPIGSPGRLLRLIWFRLSGR
ncbi:squalene/phytoene synthase family protein [Sphingomonas sp. HF-S3]|uniref:Squalene/phytoene synthase family protein n=1 Tax=Sphingomonas rustica TaxID=3103142 RepID=A0ABV0BC00_9SPHN